MKKIISIDFGTKRCGLAISDELQMIATPLHTVSNHDLTDELARLIANGDIEGFVVGQPIGLRGEETDASKAAKDLIRRLKKKFPEHEVWAEDERFTSKMAFQSMIDGNVSKKKRRDKSMIDKVSAAIILQSFLDRRSRENKKWT